MRILPIRSESQDYRTAFFTPFQPNQTSWCGHKIDVNREPKTNCGHCWAFFFSRNHEFTQQIGQQLLKDRNATVALHGAKLVKKAEQFFVMVTKAQEVSKLVEKEMQEELLQNAEYDVVVSADAIAEAAAATDQEAEVGATAVA